MCVWEDVWGGVWSVGGVECGGCGGVDRKREVVSCLDSPRMCEREGLVF